MMNRRQFITTAALAAGGLMAGSAQAQTQEALPTPDAVHGAAAGGAAQSFCFCVISDPHAAEGPNAMNEGLQKYGNSLERFFNCIRAIEQLPAGDQPDFILLTGDIHPDALGPRLGEVKIPIHAIAGNHESSPPQRAALRALWPGDFTREGEPTDYYSFVHKGVRFVGVCDVGLGGEHVGQFCSEGIRPAGQCEWLEQELAEPQARKIVFGHIPPEREGRDRNMFMSRNDSRWFNALVEKTQPTALFFGHLHLPTAEYNIGRSRLFTVRSCSWNMDRAPVGFLHVRLQNGELITREIETGRWE